MGQLLRDRVFRVGDGQLVLVICQFQHHAGNGEIELRGHGGICPAGVHSGTGHRHEVRRGMGDRTVLPAGCPEHAPPPGDDEFLRADLRNERIAGVGREREGQSRECRGGGGSAQEEKGAGRHSGGARSVLEVQLRQGDLCHQLSLHGGGDHRGLYAEGPREGIFLGGVSLRDVEPRLLQRRDQGIRVDRGGRERDRVVHGAFWGRHQQPVLRL
mmetsp:Transcript_19887/g.41168  ORF Transcript_19887/g.41168 Transcript_19887/m.41168 type:complete len:214 (-) Transcript_19887:696-1337(-)